MHCGKVYCQDWRAYRPSAIGVAVTWAGFLSDMLVCITHVEDGYYAVKVALTSSTKATVNEFHVSGQGITPQLVRAGGRCSL